MKNRLLLLALALLLVPATASAQEWAEVQAPVHLEYEGILHQGPIAHGVVVDNNDRIWISNHGGDPGEGIPVLNPDGSHADISPITSVTIDGTEIPTLGGGRGIALDHEGNILAIVNHSVLVRINSETGEGMAYWEGPGSLTSAGADEEGYVYVAPVAGTPPIRVLTPDLTSVSTEIGDPEEEYNWWSRAVTASTDGQTVVSGRLGGGLVIYQSEDLVNYELADTLLTNPEGGTYFAGDVTSTQFDDQGLLWVTDEGAGADDPEHTRSIKVFDIEQKTYYTVDHDSLDENPRGVGFSSDGSQIYVASFFNGYTRVFNVEEGTGSSTEDGAAPVAFTLDQNYPNPFNPTTTIQYTLDQPGSVTLRVYDVLGREVETLVSGKQAAGTHSTSWDATDASGKTVATGTYFYTLEVAERRVTKAMVFAK